MLVACLSRSGNTRVVADLIHREKRTDWFEIAPCDDYPADYEETVAQVSRELAADCRPILKGHVPDMASYERLYLAYPIWASTLPPPVQRFLVDHVFDRLEIVPVITHGGFGVGDSIDVIKRLAPTALIQPAFVMEGEQERRVMNRVHNWMDHSSAAAS